MINIKFNNEKGMTLIEIMVVLVILSILGTIIIPKIMGRPEQAKRVTAKTQIKSIEAALKLYKLDNGSYPDTEQGLEALVEIPTTGIIPSNWKTGGYMDKIPLDPWGSPYIYLSPGASGRDIEIISYAADLTEGGEGNDADIQSWNLE